MEPVELLKILHTVEKLKDTTRHSYTSAGRHESVSEHTFRLALAAYFIKDEFPEADMDRVIKMCLVHDLGEIFTGDIPAFDKTAADEANEARLLESWVNSLPAPLSCELAALFEEMSEQASLEARIFKALDGLEAVIQHNEADISTWEAHEYELNLRYAEDRCAFSPFLAQLRSAVRKETEEKIAGESLNNDEHNKITHKMQ